VITYPANSDYTSIWLLTFEETKEVDHRREMLYPGALSTLYAGEVDAISLWSALLA
jgi:hypothetical protein